MKNELIKYLNDNADVKYIQNENNIEISVLSTISEECLISTLGNIFAIENKAVENKEELYIKLSLRELNTKQLIAAFRFVLNQDTINDSLTILNILNLIKSNTLEESFFEDKNVYFKSLVEYLDVKLEIKDELKEFVKKFSFYFYSMIKSCGKPIANGKDTIVKLPDVYYNIFVSLDFMTLSRIAATCDDVNLADCGYISCARELIYNSLKDYFIGNTMLNMFLEGLDNADDCE